MGSRARGRPLGNRVHVERRARPRVAWHGEVVVDVGAQRVVCTGYDISESGMQVTGDWGAYPGQSVAVKFLANGRTVHAFGVVQWSTASGLNHAWGIRFTTLHARARKRIAKLVQQHRVEPAPAWSQHPTPPIGFEGPVFEADALGDLEQYVETDRMFREPSSISEDGERPEPPSIAEAPVLPPVVPVRTGQTVRVSLEDVRLQHRRHVEDVLRHVCEAHQGAVQATPGRRVRGNTVER